MSKHLTFARRRFIWVEEQPGPILLLFIVLAFALTVHFMGGEQASLNLDAESASVAQP